MSVAPRSAISLALKLDVDQPQVFLSSALETWLRSTYDVALESGEHDQLVVEWGISPDPDRLGCHLVVVHAEEQVKRSVTLIGDDTTAVVFVEDLPLKAADRPHTLVELPDPTRSLVRQLTDGGLHDFLGLSRTEINKPDGIDSEALLAALKTDLAPGLLIAVTPDDGVVSKRQAGLLCELTGFTVALATGSDLATHLAGGAGATGAVRPGSVVSIARSSSGLDAQLVGGMSLRNQADSARRLVLRHQLAAPLPFSFERQRAKSAALLMSGGQLDVASAMELLEEESQRANELQQQINETEFSLQLAWEEQDSALAELDSTLSRLRFLERAFRQFGEIPIGDPEPDDEWIPDSCVDSLTAARELLPYLFITSLEAPAYELDLHQKKSIWAKKIWSALRALNDYAHAKTEGRFDGDLARYREDPPSEAVPLLYEYAPKESESTNNNAHLRGLRVFRASRELDESGRIYMEQHVKIDKGGSNAPRIHLLDDTGGVTGKVHVGYIGPHLETSSGF